MFVCLSLGINARGHKYTQTTLIKFYRIPRLLNNAELKSWHLASNNEVKINDTKYKLQVKGNVIKKYEVTI